WRTRPDPLLDVWPRLQELLQREPSLQAKTLLGWLLDEYPERDWQRTRRTLERRVRQWKAQHGPAREVFFAQVHEPCRFGASDITTWWPRRPTRRAGMRTAIVNKHTGVSKRRWPKPCCCVAVGTLPAVRSTGVSCWRWWRDGTRREAKPWRQRGRTCVRCRRG